MTTFPLTGRWGASARATDGQKIPSSLAGRRFALATDRKLDLFASMLESRGASAVRVPLWTHWPAANEPDAQAWVDSIIAGRVNDVVWLSPDGVGCASRVAAALEQDWALAKALRKCRHFARGRMTAVALQRMGIICTDFTRDTDDDALRKSLGRHRVIRRRVALQMHHAPEDREVEKYLRWMRCDVRASSLYHLPTSRETQQVRSIVEQLIEGRIDGVLISELPEIARLFSVASQFRLRPALRQAFSATTVATFSPRVANELAHVGLPADVVPRRTYGLRPLIAQLEQRFA